MPYTAIKVSTPLTVASNVATQGSLAVGTTALSLNERPLYGRRVFIAKVKSTLSYTDLPSHPSNREKSIFDSAGHPMSDTSRKDLTSCSSAAHQFRRSFANHLHPDDVSVPTIEANQVNRALKPALRKTKSTPAPASRHLRSSDMTPPKLRKRVTFDGQLEYVRIFCGLESPSDIHVWPDIEGNEENGVVQVSAEPTEMESSVPEPAATLELSTTPSNLMQSSTDLQDSEAPLLPVHLHSLRLQSTSLASAQLSFTIYVQNIAYAKDVSVLYTLDEWRTSQVAQARWIGRCMAWEGWDCFVGEIALNGAQCTGAMAVCYKVAGQEFWDNYHAQNYAFSVCHSVSATPKWSNVKVPAKRPTLTRQSKLDVDALTHTIRGLHLDEPSELPLKPSARNAATFWPDNKPERHNVELPRAQNGLHSTDSFSSTSSHPLSTSTPPTAPLLPMSSARHCGHSTLESKQLTASPLSPLYFALVNKYCLYAPPAATVESTRIARELPEALAVLRLPLPMDVTGFTSSNTVSTLSGQVVSF
ncbi:hypothetical protein BZG36_00511 [Bifiguratus adelaidae]|uniref:CBM21 domain-containing protein n=1 Tax=Bifiguratus adelaidae TaxID=1938954 RepID=A0A261Y6Y8_9FUNG|nr:hypothetical protein BZG36_00511 [Bifiguratus adelaidae]